LAERNAPKGMLAMMQAAAKKEREEDKATSDGMAKMMKQMEERKYSVPEAKNNPIAKFMRYQMRKMLATKDPNRMLEVAKKMGASPEALKKMGAAMSKKMQNGSKTNASVGVEKPKYSRQEQELALAVEQIETAISNVSNYRKALAESPQQELITIANALNGGYIAPSPGGDPIALGRKAFCWRNRP